MNQDILIPIGAVAAFLGLAYVLFGGSNGSSDTARVRDLSGKTTLGGNILGKIKVEDTGAPRKQIEETLGKIEERQKTKKKKAKSLQSRLMQASWSTKPRIRSS